MIWLVIGVVLYYGYRRSLGLPLTETVLAAQDVHGPAIEVEYRSILLPIGSDRVDDVMTATALQLASESGTSLIVLYPIEVPLNVTMSTPCATTSRTSGSPLRPNPRRSISAPLPRSSMTGIWRLLPSAASSPVPTAAVKPTIR